MQMIRMDEAMLRIENEKSLLKAAQNVWAANKYFVLACSQRDYNEVRHLLKVESRDLSRVYDILETVDRAYHDVPTAQLPQVNNALYHIAGYFKKLITQEKRDQIISLIEDKPEEAIEVLDELTKKYEIEYLLYARFWPRLREKEFNAIPLKFKDQGHMYQANELVWLKDHLTYQPL